MARLVSGGNDPRADLERGLKILVVSAGSVLALVAATAPLLIPVLFGDKWARAADALPLIALALLVAGPIIAVGNGYLYAVGDAKKILFANAAHFMGWGAVAVPLLPNSASLPSVQVCWPVSLSKDCCCPAPFDSAPACAATPSLRCRPSPL
jgi:O-antigen/teichoic acid export membrane protein